MPGWEVEGREGTALSGMDGWTDGQREGLHVCRLQHPQIALGLGLPCSQRCTGGSAEPQLPAPVSPGAVHQPPSWSR